MIEMIIPYLPLAVVLVLGVVAGKLYSVGVRRGVDIAIDRMAEIEMHFDILITHRHGTIETTVRKKKVTHD